MLFETRESKRRDSRDDKTKKNRAEFIQRIENGASVAAARRECDIPRTTAKRLASAFKSRAKDPQALERMLNPHENRAGRRSVISKEEQGLIVQTCEHAEISGASVGIDQVKIMCAEISNDGRKGFKKGIPSDGTIRKFRADNRALTVRTYRPKDNAKVKAECYTHVKSFKTVLQHVEEDNCGIFSKGDTVWNFDETCVNSDRSRKEKVLSSTRLHHGGASRASGVGSGGKHVTDVVAISAAGDLAELFLIVEGEYKMTGWFEPLRMKAEDIKVLRGGVDLRPYCEESWFPSNGCVQMQGAGSMTKDLMPIFLQHFRVQVDKTHPHLSGKQVVLLTDGHSSRSRADVSWIEKARKLSLVVALSPANTTHFLQACDHIVNKSLSKWVTETKEAMLANGMISVHTVQAKLIMAVESHKRLSRSEIVKSWEDIGLFPMDYRFLTMFEEKFKAAAQATAEARNELANGEGAASCESSHPRKSDAVIAAELREILADGEVSDARKLQSVSTQLQREKTTGSILQDALRPPQRQASATPQASARMTDGQATAKNGMPAEYMTHEQSLIRFKEAAQKKEAERIEKEQNKEARKQKALLRKENEKVRRDEIAAKRALAAVERENATANRKRAKEQKQAEKHAMRASKAARTSNASTRTEGSGPAGVASKPSAQNIPASHTQPVPQGAALPPLYSASLLHQPRS